MLRRNLFHKYLTWIILTALCPIIASAAVIYLVEDEFDDPQIIRQLSDSSIPEDIKQLEHNARAEIEKLEESELIKLFGQPVPRPKLLYALPLGQNRGAGFGGLGYVKDETKFFIIADQGAVERHTAFYSSGSPVSQSFLLFRVDDKFLKLDSLDKVSERLAWERTKWPLLLESIRERKEKESEHLKKP